MDKHNIPAFLLIHGFTGTHYEMDPLADFLNKKNFHVKNIILPGHETALEDLASTKWQEWVDYAQGILKELKTEYEHVFVCGLSMGGIITLILGAMNKDISGIIPLAAPIKSPDWRMFLIAYLPFLHIFYPRHKNEETGWEDLDSLATHKGYGTYPIKSIKQLYEMFKHVQKQITKIEVPMLVVNAKKDPSVSLEHAEYIINNAKSTDKSLIRIDRGGHVIPKDAGKEQLFREIEKWLEGRI